MSSSEEYLDNLLKAITEGNAYEGPSPSMAQDMAGVEDEQGISASEEPDTTMSMDDMEAMFASMGAETTEGETQEDAVIPSDELALDDSLLSDELVPDDSMLSDELPIDEGMLSDELALDEGMLSDEPAIDEGMLSDELAIDEGMLSEELGLNEEPVTDELVPDDSMLSDELPIDEGMLSDELALDEGMLSDEPVLDEGMLSDEPVLDEGMLSEELGLNEEPAIDEGMLSDELALDDSMLSDESTADGEAITDDLSIDEAIPDELTPEESMEENTASDDLSLDELGLADLGLEDLGLEEAEQDGAEAGEDFALEDGTETGEDLALEDGTETGEDFALGDGIGEGDGFALEEAGEDDADLSALLASMGGDDDLSEINDLLEKSDQGVAVDDDMMAMLDGVSDGDSADFFSGEEATEGNHEDIREITPEELAERENPKSKQQKKKEEKEKKKREKQAKKAKNKNASQGETAGEEGADDLSGLLEGTDENGEEPKKKGAFAKFIDFLLEEDEEEGEGDSEDVGVVIGNLSEENKELLAELKAEDKKNAKKKDKKDKKAKKGKKGKAEDGDDEEEAVAAKPKKPKKEKKKKEKIVEEEPRVPEKRLSKKKVVSVFLFCATIAACLVVVTILLPEQLDKQEARVAFDQSQYTQVYELLYGKELNEEEEILLHKSSTILRLQRKLDSYENYEKMDMPLEALNALLEGVSRYQNLRNAAELYNVSGELADIYGQILDALANNYGLSESDALDIIASGDDVTYSQRVQAVISGEAFGMEEEAVPEGKQDVLPEEEEIIDRLEGTETE